MRLKEAGASRERLWNAMRHPSDVFGLHPRFERIQPRRTARAQYGSF